MLPICKKNVCRWPCPLRKMNSGFSIGNPAGYPLGNPVEYPVGHAACSTLLFLQDFSPIPTGFPTEILFMIF